MAKDVIRNCIYLQYGSKTLLKHNYTIISLHSKQILTATLAAHRRPQRGVQAGSGELPSHQVALLTPEVNAVLVDVGPRGRRWQFGVGGDLGVDATHACHGGWERGG